MDGSKLPRNSNSPLQKRDQSFVTFSGSKPSGFSTNVNGDHALEFGDRVVVVIDMESGQRFIIRCEAAIPLPALVHVLS